MPQGVGRFKLPSLNYQMGGGRPQEPPTPSSPELLFFYASTATPGVVLSTRQWFEGTLDVTHM